LIELMVTLVILAILAAIAVPAYLDYVRRGKLAEGTGNLSNLYLDMQQYYQDNRSFLAGTNCGVTAAATKNFTYSCTATATPSTLPGQPRATAIWVLQATTNTPLTRMEYDKPPHTRVRSIILPDRVGSLRAMSADT